MNYNDDVVIYRLFSQYDGDDYFTIGCCEQGKGLFTNVNIPAKTVVMTVPLDLLKITATTYTQSGIAGVISLRDEKKADWHHALYFNHSSSPNVRVDAFGHAIALNHIFDGDELLINYNDLHLIDVTHNG
jgi:hypothetical protein